MHAPSPTPSIVMPGGRPLTRRSDFDFAFFRGAPSLWVWFCKGGSFVFFSFYPISSPDAQRLPQVSLWGLYSLPTIHHPLSSRNRGIGVTFSNTLAFASSPCCIPKMVVTGPWLTRGAVTFRLSRVFGYSGDSQRKPLQVIRVIHAARNAPQILK